MARKNENKRLHGILSRLRQDQTGNVIAMVGASLIPMLAIIGGAVDISRGYMVKVRLQQACDAGALGGRKAVGEGTFDSNAAARAQAMFNANFPAGYQGSTGTSFVPSTPDSGTTIKGVATTLLPTVVMGLFKSESSLKGLKTQSIQLTTECNAVMEVTNSDVTMVLDTTGSMAWESASGSSITRMDALRSSTINFATILNTAASKSSTRMRFALVPFAQTVNVGKLIYGLNPSYIMGGNANENWNYQTRRPVYKVTGPPTDTTVQETLAFQGVTMSVVRQTYCNEFAANKDTGGYGSNNGTSWTELWRYPSDYGFTNSGQNVSKSGDPGAVYTFSLNTWGPDTPSYNAGGNNRKSCTRNVRRIGSSVTYSYDGLAPGATFSHYEFGQFPVAVSAYVQSGLTGGAAAADPFTNRFENPPGHTWNGCIMERDTSAATNITFDGATKKITPIGLWDLDIDAAPDGSAASRWRPYWPEAYYTRSSVSSGSKITRTNCPAEARGLATMTTPEFTTYVNNLIPSGATYHDIGVLWGLRLSSPQGIFASQVNAAPPNNGYVQRHMIIFSDGEPSVDDDYVTAYGVEKHDRLTTANGSSTELFAAQSSRFNAICEATKAKGIRIWFVVLGTNMSPTMTACASPGSTFATNSAAQLNSAFVQIAQSIAELRLTSR